MDFDPGEDPLQPNADILSQERLLGDPARSTQGSDEADDYSYYAAYDDAGGFWVSSFDENGDMHWYRWDRKSGDGHDGPHGELHRLDGNRDLPPNALVTLDRSGRWVVTYVDSHGQAQRFYRSAAELHADGRGAGAWRVVVDKDGGRSLRREDEDHAVPHDFHHFAYADHGVTHENGAANFHGFANSARPGYPYGAVGITYPGAVIVDNHLVGSTGLPSGYGVVQSAGAGTSGMVATVRSAPTIVVASPPPRTH